VSVYTIQDQTVTPAGKVTIADDKSGTGHVAIAPDDKLALVTRDGDDRISVLSIDGTKVEYTNRDISAGLRPYGIDIASSGASAAVANIGPGSGDADTVSIIDLKARPYGLGAVLPQGRISHDAVGNRNQRLPSSMWLQCSRHHAAAVGSLACRRSTASRAFTA
jgi:DNA-binding beta-propeller fold protein YncE